MTHDYPTAFSCWGPEEHEAIQRVIASGQFTQAHEVRAFEEEFAAFHSMKHAVMVNSGSSANLIAVAALFHKSSQPLQRSDKVVVPALAWSTTYAPLVQHGLDLVLADCDETWCATTANLAVHDVKLIVGCSILGNPGHLDHWRYIAKKIGAYFIEDNCESFGAVSREINSALFRTQLSDPGKATRFTKLCGTFGLFNTFSFFHSHQISAIEGGMILTDDDELADLCRCLRDHGWNRSIRCPSSFEEEYDFSIFGYNVRGLELNAAVAREQLKKSDGLRKFREANWNNFALWTEGLPIRLQRKNGIMNPFGIAFTVDSSEKRAQLVKAFRENGIDCRLPTGGSFTKHQYGARWRGQATPNADRIHDTGLFLGNAPFDLHDRLLKAIGVMERVL